MINMHRWGDKRDIEARIDALDRALRSGMRTIGIGALLGLADPQYDILATYRHARYLLKNYWQFGVSISFPRIFLPEIPLVLSTREPQRVRDGMAGLGITKMSGASKTTVGGYSDESEESIEKFSISDERGIPEFSQKITAFAIAHHRP